MREKQWRFEFWCKQKERTGSALAFLFMVRFLSFLSSLFISETPEVTFTYLLPMGRQSGLLGIGLGSMTIQAHTLFTKADWLGYLIIFSVSVAHVALSLWPVSFNCVAPTFAGLFFSGFCKSNCLWEKEDKKKQGQLFPKNCVCCLQSPFLLECGVSNRPPKLTCSTNRLESSENMSL